MRPSTPWRTRMLGLDPNYGSQEHQASYLARIDIAHELAPCPIAEDKPTDAERAAGHDTHAHSLVCYSAKATEAATHEYARRRHG